MARSRTKVEVTPFVKKARNKEWRSGTDVCAKRAHVCKDMTDQKTRSSLHIPSPSQVRSMVNRSGLYNLTLAFSNFYGKKGEMENSRLGWGEFRSAKSSIGNFTF